MGLSENNVIRKGFQVLPDDCVSRDGAMQQFCPRYRLLDDVAKLFAW